MGRGPRSVRRPEPPPRLGPLLWRSVSTYFRSLPVIAAVVLATALPAQLALAWLFVRLGLEQDPSWQGRYQGLADLTIGCLTIPATLIAILAALEGPRLGPLRALARAYRAALGVWVGTFVTRLMVSFIVLVAGGLPLLVGMAVVGWVWPDAPGLLDGAQALETASLGELWPLLLPLPLAAGGVVVFLWYALAEVVVALERVDGFAALERSRALTAGVRRQVLAGLLLLSGPVLAAELATYGAGARVGVWWGAALTSALLVASALPATFLVCLFVERRRAVPRPVPVPDVPESG